MIEMRIDAPLGELESRLDFVEDSIHRFPKRAEGIRRLYRFFT
jgi:hypothetical protein